VTEQTTNRANPRDTRVGFIGLGIMGRPMAVNILNAGYRLVVCSRSPGPAEALVAAGAQAVGHPAEVARTCDIVVVMVPSTDDLQDVCRGAQGLLAGAHPGMVLIDMGTHDPVAMPRLARRLSRTGARLLDAPVSGGEAGARDASLAIMVGGSSDALHRAWPVLATMGSSIVHVGDIGAGMVAKACNQLVVGSAIEAVAEALTLARAAGVDPGKVREALMGGFAASRVLEVHGTRMLRRDFVPGARVEIHAKDARIILGLATRLHVDVPGFRPVASALERLTLEGGAALDHSALVTLLE
jgi:2-hydroxy-3-oxopropionate reductase